jgi:hypothetical protein
MTLMERFFMFFLPHRLHRFAQMIPAGWGTLMTLMERFFMFFYLTDYTDLHPFFVSHRLHGFAQMIPAGWGNADDADGAHLYDFFDSEITRIYTHLHRFFTCRFAQIKNADMPASRQVSQIIF